jgi:hypothetical protein
MVDFNALLAQKYAILGQHADAAQLGAQAGMYEAQSKRPLYSAEAGLNNAQAAGIPQNIAIARQQANTAQFGEMARAPLYGAQANLENTQAQLAPGSALAQNNLAGAQAGSMNAQTGVTNMHLGPTTLDAQLWLNQNPSKTLTDYFAAHPGQAPAGHLATGTSRVSGKGSGMVDTVQAKLAPKEAVLNAGAAEHLGRPVIQALNAIGVAKMGMVPPADDRVKGANAAQTAGKTGHYAKGVAKAAKGGKGGKGAPKAQPSDTPALSQIDPQTLMAALQMGQGGMGMAPPGGIPPGGIPQGQPQMPAGGMGMS